MSNNYVYLYDINAKKYIKYIDSENRFIPSNEMVTKFSFVYDYDNIEQTKDQYFIYLYPNLTMIYDNNGLYITDQQNISSDFKIVKNTDNTISIYDSTGKYFLRVQTPEPNNPQFKQYIMDNNGEPVHLFLKYPNGPDYKPPSPDLKLKYTCGILGCKSDVNGKFDSIDECSKNCHSLLYLTIGIIVLIFLVFIVVYFLGKNTKHKKRQFSY
jgi:hypothetical protein